MSLFYGDLDSDTICGLSTPQGVGGISIVRISGSYCVEIVRKIAAFVPKNPESHRVLYGHLSDGTTQIDEVLITYFEAARSFTGEPVCEISCHGNPIIVDKIIEHLVLGGCRIAGPGEFTYRAFINNRIDLIQAESILGVIHGKTNRSVSVALKHLDGEISEKIEMLEDDLIWCLANIEAGIDFSTEGIEVVNLEALVEKIVGAQKIVRRLIESFKQGRVLRDGIKVGLFGRPNVGKSSLFNQLVGEERAIVASSAGTTRDFIECSRILDGFLLRFFDTAGLRVATDEAEVIGVERSRLLKGKCDICLFIFDSTEGFTLADKELLGEFSGSQLLVLGNKSDRLAASGVNEAVSTKIGHDVMYVSAFNEQVSDEISKKIRSLVTSVGVEDASVIFSKRQFELLLKCEEKLSRISEEFKMRIGLEFLAADLKQTLIYLQEILGKRFDDQILDRVFSEFCIGK